MEKFGKNIFTETICKDSTSRTVGNTNLVNSNNKNGTKILKVTSNHINNEVDLIGKSNHKNGINQSDNDKNKIADFTSLEGFSDKKLKLLIYLSNNSSNVKLEEIQTATWSGLPYGK